MPKGKPLTDEERREIYEARMSGESRAEIARAYGLATASVTAIVRNYRNRQEGENMAHRECIVAGNKKTGRLVSTCDPHRYDGTCVVAGKANSRTFVADNAAAATELWVQWCSELRKPKEQPKVVQTHEKATPSVVEAHETVNKPVVEPVKPEKEADMDKVYVIWAKGENPRLYGAYTSMERALSELDQLNEVAAFLVSDCVFEIEEVSLKS